MIKNLANKFSCYSVQFSPMYYAIINYPATKISIYKYMLLSFKPLIKCYRYKLNAETIKTL